MRIRKHAKISPLVYAASSLQPGTVLETHVCKLNQSPWDVITFPTTTSTSTSTSASAAPSPSPSFILSPPTPPSSFYLQQVEEDDGFEANGNIQPSIKDTDSVRATKFFVEKETRRELNNAVKWEYSDEITAVSECDDRRAGLKKKEEEEIVLCCKTDSKGWQCGREVKQGQTVCEYHLSQQQKNCLKKSDKSSRRTRAKKPNSSSSNPYEFYYYSGFGPRWSKRSRAGPGKATILAPAPPAAAAAEGNIKSASNTSSSTGAVPKNDASETNGTTSSSSQIGNSNFREEFDFVEDIEEEDDDDDDEENGGESNGRKRPRKPIKARSLKSLM